MTNFILVESNEFFLKNDPARLNGFMRYDVANVPSGSASTNKAVLTKLLNIVLYAVNSRARKRTAGEENMPASLARVKISNALSLDPEGKSIAYPPAPYTCFEYDDLYCLGTRFNFFVTMRFWSGSRTKG